MVGEKMKRIGIRRLESPLDARPLRKRDVAIVRQRFGFLAGIGRVGENRLEMNYRRTRLDLKTIIARTHADGTEMEVARPLQILKNIAVMRIVDLLHTVTDAIDNNRRLVGHLVALDSDTHHIIILLRSSKIIVFKHKCKRSGTLVERGMVDNALRRLRDERRSNQQGYSNENQRNGDKFHILQIAAQIDGLQERHR